MFCQVNRQFTPTDKAWSFSTDSRCTPEQGTDARQASFPIADYQHRRSYHASHSARRGTAAKTTEEIAVTLVRTYPLRTMRPRLCGRLTALYTVIFYPKDQHSP